MKRRVGALLAIALLAAPTANAASGDLDPSFGDAGRVVTDFGGSDEARSVAIDGQGRVVSAGSGALADTTRPGATAFSLARYLPDGSLDISFGDDGLVQTDFGTMASQVRSVEIDPEGRIVAVGTTTDFDGTGASIALARYLPGGSPDPTFGSEGEVITRLGLSGASDAAIDSRGRIAVVGDATDRGVHPTVLRYLPDGTLDPAFSGDGIRRIRAGELGSFTGLALDPDDRIVLAGSTDAPRTGRDRFTAMRLLESGGNDDSFGRDGRVVLFGGSGGRAAAVVVDPAGLVVAGSCGCGEGGESQIAIARLRDGGDPAKPFGKGGILRIGFGGPAEATSLARARDGGIVIAGTGLVRVTSRGDLDRTFSGDGRATLIADVAGVAVADTRAIITAGRRPGATDTDFAVDRYLP